MVIDRKGQENMEEKLLRVNNLDISFKSKKSVVPVVEGVSFYVDRGEIIGLVGESGCGKSVTSLSLLQLNASNTLYGEKSSIFFEGEDLLKKKRKEMQKVRGAKISVIFQDSLTGLDPVMQLGKIMTEAVRSHRRISREEALKECINMLESVGIPSPELRIKEYAHQLSGGMRQRVMIALAMLHRSKLLIADEPTTALDVTIQDHILELIRCVRDEIGMSVLLITHDMGVVAEMTDRVYVMYSGRIVETGATADIFEHPLHPYTRGLMKSIPRLDQPENTRLFTIPGNVPSPGSIRKGCRFCNRCQESGARCREEEPPMFQIGKQQTRCWNYKQAGEECQ